MLSAAELKADYRAFIGEAGETITIRRYTGTGASRPWFDVAVLARVVELTPAELVGTVFQGQRKVILLTDDLIQAQMSPPLRKGDKAIIRGRECNIDQVNDNTRRAGGVLIAYELTVTGLPA